MSVPHAGWLAIALAAVLPLLACDSGGPAGLDTARQDTFGFVYDASADAPSARGLRVVWSRGPLQVGRVEPFGETEVVGDAGRTTEFWGGELSPGDTAAAVIGFDGDPKPEPVTVCFSEEEGRPISCR